LDPDIATSLSTCHMLTEQAHLDVKCIKASCAQIERYLNCSSDILVCMQHAMLAVQATEADNGRDSAPLALFVST